MTFTEFSKDMVYRFTSRKFLLAAFALFVVFAKRFGLELSPDEINAVIEVVIVFTVVEGAADVVSRYSAN